MKLGLFAFTLKFIEEFNMDVMKIFHTIISFTEKPENEFMALVKGIPFNGL